MKNQKSTDLNIADSNKRVKTNNAACLIFFFPVDIIIDILSRLPVDSLIQCKRVCKTWRSIVDDSTFLALLTHRSITSSSAAHFCFLLFVTHKDHHLFSTTYYRLHFGEYHDDVDVDVDEGNNNYANKNKKKIIISNHHVKQSSNNKPLIPHYPFDHHPSNNLKRVSSCNGLLLITSISYNYDDDDMMVFNPLTREYVCLPPLAGLVPQLEHSMTSTTGFGYLPSTNEYKVVTIMYPPPAEEEEGSQHGYVFVYTLGSGRWRWRSIDSSYSVFHYMGVLLNGALHWIGVTAHDGVLSFDLANEELKILQSPPLDSRMESRWPDIDQQLGVLEGCLCVSRIFSPDISSTRTDIWVLMKNHEYPAADADSCNIRWTIKFNIFPTICGKYEFVGALESGKILFSTFCNRRSRLHIIAYDPETGSVHEHDQSESFCAYLKGHSSMINLIPHVKSFVSLKALGEETAKYI